MKKLKLILLTLIFGFSIASCSSEDPLDEISLEKAKDGGDHKPSIPDSADIQTPGLTHAQEDEKAKPGPD